MNRFVIALGRFPSDGQLRSFHTANSTTKQKKNL